MEPVNSELGTGDRVSEFAGYMLSDRMWIFLAALALFYAAVWVIGRRRADRKITPDCTWLQERRSPAGRTRWVCQKCSVDAYTLDGKPPAVCKRYAMPARRPRERLPRRADGRTRAPHSRTG